MCLLVLAIVIKSIYFFLASFVVITSGSLTIVFSGTQPSKQTRLGLPQLLPWPRARDLKKLQPFCWDGEPGNRGN